MSAAPELALSRQLVRLLLARQRDGLPPGVRAKAALHIADAIGSGLAAARSGALADQVLRAMRTGTGAGPCAVIGSAERLPPAQAAFANAALFHVLDFDDIHDAARLHPTTVSLGAALAAAGLAPTTGARLVEAVALGNELMCRLGLMLSPTGEGPGSDWFLTQLFGYFGATLACGVVLGHDEDRIVSALGLAYMQAAGGKQAGFGTGSTARAIYPAFAAQGGLQACLIAAAGMDGPEQALDGAAGLFKAYLGIEADAARRALLLADGWAFDAVQIKPWPSCRLSHPYVVAAFDVRESLARLPLAPEAASIDVYVNGSAAKLCRPLPQRRRPQTLQDAKYSIPWMVAFCLVHGRVDLWTLGEHALGDARVHAVADRVHIHETLADKPGHPPAEIHLRTPDGRTLRSAPVGEIPVTPQGVQTKFDDSLRYAGRSPAQAAQLWRQLLALDAASDTDFIHSST